MAVVETIEDVKKQILATLAPYLGGVHSVVLIGSWAHGEQEEAGSTDQRGSRLYQKNSLWTIA